MKRRLKPTSAARKKTKFRYYDLKKNWRKVRPHLSDPLANYILIDDFNKFTRGIWKKPFLHGQYPAEFDRDCWSDDEFDEERTSPRYAYMDYVAPGACHWLANFALRLAMLTEPSREWRVISSEYHSTVWDGRNTLFEFNWQAFGTPPADCFQAAFDLELPPGEYMEVGVALRRDE